MKILKFIASTFIYIYNLIRNIFKKDIPKTKPRTHTRAGITMPGKYNLEPDKCYFDNYITDIGTTNIRRAYSRTNPRLVTIWERDTYKDFDASRRTKQKRSK